MKTQLHGALLYGKHPWQDFITEPLTENRLQIVWISTGKTAFNKPIAICFSEEQGGSCYSIRAKDAAASPDFSKWTWVAV